MKFKLILPILVASALTFGGCAATSDTPAPTPAPGATTATTASSSVLSNTLAAIEKFGNGAITDLKSPAGQKLLGVVATGALEVAADVASKNVVGAVVSGSDALAGTLEAYSTLPTTSANIASITSTASGVPVVASQVAPAVNQIIQAATAKVKGTATTAAVIQATANGLFALGTVAPVTAAP